MRLAEHLDHLWRQIGTGCAFLLLFGGGAILAVTLFPVLQLGAYRCRATRVQTVIHLLFRFYIRMLQILRIIELRVEDGEKLSAAGGRLIIANHPTLLDVVLLMTLVPRAQCIVKSELWSSPYLGGVMRSAGYIRNDLPTEQLIGACREALEQGRNLIIFPEGTRSTPGEPLRFRRGFANIATHLGAELQLVTITCTPPTLLKGDKWWMVPRQRPQFRIAVDKRIHLNDWTGSEYRSLATRRLVRHLEEYYMERLANV